MKNIPEKIYLNITDEAWSTTDFNELMETTWCKDKLNQNDIEYTLNKRTFPFCINVYGCCKWDKDICFPKQCDNYQPPILCETNEKCKSCNYFNVEVDGCNCKRQCFNNEFYKISDSEIEIKIKKILDNYIDLNHAEIPDLIIELKELYHV